MKCTRIVKLQDTHTGFEVIRLTNIIGTLYQSKTKKNNYKANEVFVDSKIIKKSRKTRISLLRVERVDLYM